RFTGVPDDTPLAVAFGAGALDGEEALVGANLSVTGTGWARLRLGARCGARAGAFFAGDQSGDANLGALAVKSVFQRDFHVVAEVAAAIGAIAAALTAPHEFAEQIVEDVGERGGEVETLRSTSAHAAFECGVTEAVIRRTLVGIA